jgi:hypothetical protein
VLWAVHVARTGEIRKAYNNYVGSSRRKITWKNKALMEGDVLNASNAVGETEWKGNCSRRSCRWEGNIKLDLK